MRAAASRTFCTAGNSRPMRIDIIAITTKSSMSVNAERKREELATIHNPFRRVGRNMRKMPGSSGSRHGEVKQPAGPGCLEREASYRVTRQAGLLAYGS